MHELALTAKVMPYVYKIRIAKLEKWQMNTQFTISLRRYLINRVIDETASKKLSRYNFVQQLWIEKLEIMGIDIPDERLTLDEQRLAQTLSFRLNASVELALKLKLIKNQQIACTAGEKEYLTSLFVTTRLGRFFRRIPSSCQSTILFIAVLSQRFVGTANRFKWLSGVISFAILSLKVWHSGLIDKAWIGASAIAGLAIAALVSVWR